ncbi:aspartate aminotransferase family protein [Candidatus Borrarchaeum sp.]|uniref:aspartate aminotransferase family protein n=1 Tax=Candidatus Borrarchaeum sp. TaxID=2846742 RepID=UPI002580C6FC|nr:aspartate aminotransferase family protein [Candidatus Borrarchaeum sp.]
MNSQEIMQLEDEYLSNVYPKRNVAIVKGQGALLWDADGKEYIDCIGGHGSCNIGHCHPRVIKAIEEQLPKLMICPSILYSDIRAVFGEKIAKLTPSGLSKSFLSNSGAEAVECAIKLARKYTKKTDILAMKKGFHGRLGFCLSATWKPKYRKPFEPLNPGFSHAKFGDIQSIKDAITEKTAAVLVESIQGEGGINPAPEGFLQELRELCNAKDILFILDEIQTGFGRTGKMFACEHWDVVPDIMCLAKSVAGGVPMGVTLAKENIMNAFDPGEHGTTFGGNPIACAAANASLDVLVDERLPERASEMGAYFKKKLSQLKEKYKIIRDVRGTGLMIGVELRFDCRDILLGALERGILILSAGRNVLRFLPPLVIKEEHIDYVIDTLNELFREQEANWMKK